jgi:hypothetical protein
VFVGVRVPQPGGAFGQVTVQLTPAFVVSFVTVAAIFAVPLTNMVVGGACPDVKAIEMAVEGVIVTVAVTNFVLSAVDVAVMVIVLPLGTAAGAV